ncbi:MAG TPA: 16S rRNA (cytidine(1402)-2'-O)-methyltransferase [Stellaceae bacterium]|nr:16S rRNA (cytidine(1402)-2'-O)-methyltransferase [Stellaceae bacterium]
MSLETKGGREPIPPARATQAALAPGLYVVATPIGNAEDITLRALRVLRQADVIACEDTRVSAKLLERHGIATQRVAYHDHSGPRVAEALLDRIAGGAAVALISDAGTPLLSDPGFPLVRDALARGLAVTVLPGPAAPLAALVLSGLPAERFLFAGFLPAKPAARQRALDELKAVPATLLFLETAPRLADALDDMAQVLGDRPAAVARELTKLHEEVRRASLAALAAHYREAGPPKGEIVMVVGPPGERAPALDAAALDAKLAEALAAMSVKDASAAVAAATGLPRRAVYARALVLARRGG